MRVALRWRHDPGQVKALLASYAYMAAWLYALVVAAGTVAAVLVLPTVSSLWTTGYGQVLLVKLALVTLISGAALVARRRLAATGGPTTRSPLQVARVESVALVGVLAASAMLTAVTPPADPRQGVAFPPPAFEPTVRLGALTGQVTTGIVASKGQLEVRLRVPEPDPAAEQLYEVTGTLTQPRGRPAELALRPCGSGCFTADAEWFPGVSKLDLSVRAEGFTGGRARFDAPQPAAQPARDARRLLDHMLAAMKREPSLVFTEAVTSDTSRPTPPAARHHETGAALIDLQPYRTGVVSGLTFLNQQAGITEIGFAISAESTYARIWINDRGRIVREQLVTPNHLITRTYTYP